LLLLYSFTPLFVFFVLGLKDIICHLLLSSPRFSSFFFDRGLVGDSTGNVYVVYSTGEGERSDCFASGIKEQWDFV